MSDPHEISADHAKDCFGCEHLPGAVHCTTQSGAEHEALMAVQRAHLTLAARAERLTQSTAGARAGAAGGGQR